MGHRPTTCAGVGGVRRCTAQAEKKYQYRTSARGTRYLCKACYLAFKKLGRAAP